MAMLNEFDNLLQGLLSLKPPGITTSKIKEFTTLCSQNVQSESILIQKLYMQFKKSPASHKLGILYIVDSVARDYMTQAKKANEEYSPSAPDGTYYAGLNRIKDILPSLINDMAQYAPEHKDKIYKLFDIWQRGATFPPEAIAQWRTKLASPPTSPNAVVSTTPLGSPPQLYQNPTTNGTQPQQSQASQSNAASLLQALANMAKQNKPSGASGVSLPVVSTPPPAAPTAQTAPVIPPQQTPAPLNQALPAPFNALGALPPSLAPNFASLLPTPLPLPQTQQAPQQTPAQFPQFPQTQLPLQPNVADPNLQAGQMALLQLLLQQPGLANLPVNQLGTALGSLFGVPAAGAAPSWQQAAQQQQQQQPHAAPASSRFDEPSAHNRARNYSPPPRSPHYRRGRSRSRSPPGAYGKHRDSPPFRRRSPTYNDYEEGTDIRVGARETDYHRGAGGGRGRGRRGSPRRDRSRSPPARNGRRNNERFDQGNEPSGPKFYEHDPTVPSDSIKVYSRTLFVGGVARNTEQELRDLFENYGRVQTCIVNYDKRHAFIKMYTRKDAVAAKEAMEQYRSPEMTLRTRWGVGFGPRDCSDYATGISIIPIDRLTDADKRWMLTAANGGTGGQPLVGGIAVEEPDIEIGQGVSSKAMSKRRPAETSRGGQSSEDSPHSSRRSDRQASAEVTTGGVAPPTPNFGSAPFAGFPYTFPQGLPAGWMYSGQQQQQ